MIKYFSSGFPVQFITIGIVSFLPWGISLFHPPAMPEPYGPVPLYDLLYGYLSGWPVIAVLLGYGMIFFEAVWINYLLAKHNLIPVNTSLATFLFMVFVSLFPQGLTLTPINITLLFLLFMLQEMLKAYHAKEPESMFYIAGFFAGLASLFFFPAIFLYGFLIICIFIYRSSGWREWFSSITGLLTPFIFLFSVLFLLDGTHHMFDGYQEFFTELNPDLKYIRWTDWILLGFNTLLILLGIADVLAHSGERTAEQRKKSALLFWLFIWAAATIPFTDKNITTHFILTAIGSTYVATNLLFHQKKPWKMETLVWLLIVAIVTNTIATTFFQAVI